MTKPKIFSINKEKIKILTIVVLTSTFLLGIIFSNENKVARILEEKFFDFDFNSISKIETELEGTLTKLGKDWRLTYNKQNIPVDNKKVNSLIKALDELQKNKLVSRDQKKHKELGIGENPSFKLFDNNNKLLTEIFVGKSGEGDSRLAYIKGSDENVYLTKNIFLSYKGNSYNTFSDTTLFQEKNTKLETLSFEIIRKLNKENENNINNNYEITTKDGLYFLNNQKMVKERPLNIIAEFKADGLEIDKSKIDDYNLQYKIQAQWSNKSVNNIEVYFNKKEENDKDILIKKDKDEYYYTTSKWTFFDVFDLEKKLLEKDNTPSNGNQEDHHEHHDNAD
ncbi:DUF4340 domain-containing protein [Borreliella carolinensis]|uniref:DUF4340 domain-containing protein n=1 Tax=Borreliella carolinensis TaxID=478174 RepID=A0ABY9E933_9SPIR|nr:DUF4340 domain-containing protein [Borreliella carolinensis]WKC91109.1 DUF4340 domain-containing protein [Borreliella carolinensis]WNY68043.1 DUF4340 domain-containing protein [Borreliella carolinensis]